MNYLKWCKYNKKNQIPESQVELEAIKKKVAVSWSYHMECSGQKLDQAICMKKKYSNVPLKSLSTMPNIET